MPFAQARPESDEDAGLYNYLAQLEKEAVAFERERLFYVAVTRARSKVVLSACLADKRDSDTSTLQDAPAVDDLGAPDKGSMLGRAWPAIVDTPSILTSINIISPEADDIAPAPDLHSQQELFALRRFESASVSKLLSRIAVQANSVETSLGVLGGATNEKAPGFIDGESDDDTKEQSWRKLAGIVYHDMMERFNRALNGRLLQEWRSPKPMHEIHIENLLRRTALEQGIELDAQEFEGAKTLIVSALRNTLDGPNGQWLLDQRHSKRRAELAIAWRREDKLAESRIDLCFVDEEDRHWIVDYKLVEHAAGQEEVILEQYRAQLQHYAALLWSENGEKGPDAALRRLALYLPLDDKLLILNEN